MRYIVILLSLCFFIHLVEHGEKRKETKLASIYPKDRPEYGFILVVDNYLPNNYVETSTILGYKKIVDGEIVFVDWDNKRVNKEIIHFFPKQ